MGSEYPQCHACKTRVRDGNRQHYEPDGQHILTLLFPSARCASLHSGYAVDDGLLDCQHLHLYVHEDIFEASQQEALEDGGGYWCSADLVPVVDPVWSRGLVRWSRLVCNEITSAAPTEWSDFLRYHHRVPSRSQCSRRQGRIPR